MTKTRQIPNPTQISFGSEAQESVFLLSSLVILIPSVWEPTAQTIPPPRSKAGSVSSVRPLELPVCPCFHPCPCKGGSLRTDTITRGLILYHTNSISCEKDNRVFKRAPEQTKQTSLCYILAISKYIQRLPFLKKKKKIALEMYYRCLLCSLFIPWNSLASVEWHLSALLLSD